MFGGFSRFWQEHDSNATCFSVLILEKLFSSFFWSAAVPKKQENVFRVVIFLMSFLVATLSFILVFFVFGCSCLLFLVSVFRCFFPRYVFSCHSFLFCCSCLLWIHTLFHQDKNEVTDSPDFQICTWCSVSFCWVQCWLLLLEGA